MREEALTNPQVDPGGGEQEGGGFLSTGGVALPELGQVVHGAVAQDQALGLVQLL